MISDVLNSSIPDAGGFSCTIVPFKPAVFAAPLMIAITFAIGVEPPGIFISPVSIVLPLPSLTTSLISPPSVIGIVIAAELLTTAGPGVELKMVSNPTLDCIP